jgi:2,4-dienoyl-CoA reductase-like NADH-dependent reductase (Old Yellow Enzyme family)
MKLSILFTPMKIGDMEIKNRFIRSATCEGMANEKGEVTEALLEVMTTLAKGEIGLIIPGYMYIDPVGQAFKYQTGIYSDDLIPGLKKMVDAVHSEEGKIAFQIVHTGMQTTDDLIGTNPIAPSKRIMNPFTMKQPKEMDEDDINHTIQSFIDAARRAVQAGADAIQLHAAHGYLINQFLSPFFNRRKDDWSGSEENMFQYLKKIFLETKKVMPNDMPLFIKLNTNDYTPKEGINPQLAAKYAGWLNKLGIDAIEISCGTSYFSMFNIFRGKVPVKEMVKFFLSPVKELAEKVFQDMVGKYNFEGPYNLEAARVLKPVIDTAPLILVGGLRNISEMEEIVQNKYADFISMSRPFIREPYLVKNFKAGMQNKASCVSCNRCAAALIHNFPQRCYLEEFPEELSQ